MEALEAIHREWPMLRGALLLHVEIVRTYMKDLLGRAALATAVESGGPAEAIEHARRSARVRSRMKPHFARGGGHYLRAALAHREGEEVRAVSELEKAVREFDADRMGLHANCARYRLGELIGGDSGRELVQGFQSWAAEQGIKNAKRMVAVNAPGFNE